MLHPRHARRPTRRTRLEEAGLFAYNHNLDTSAQFYPSIITTRTYQDRLDTIANLRQTNITLCCGGIIGMGETAADRVDFLHTLATLDPHPESVPINVLSRVPGTPLADQPDVAIEDTVRVIATARILMPTSMVRIAAGRHLMSSSDQALCFLAGANSIFSSEEGMMLTEAVPCAEHDGDAALLAGLGLHPRARHLITAGLAGRSRKRTTSAASSRERRPRPRGDRLQSRDRDDAVRYRPRGDDATVDERDGPEEAVDRHDALVRADELLA